MESVFIGSSTENRTFAQKVAVAMRDLHDVKIRAWWHDGVFRENETFIESLEREADGATSAVFVFGGDDEAEIREERYRIPRDNVVLEYGLFVGKVGRPRVAIIQLDDAKIPADLQGMKVIQVKSADDPNALLDYLSHRLSLWQEDIRKHPSSVHPRLKNQLGLLLPTLRTLDSHLIESFDRNAARLVETLFLSVLTDSQGVNSGFVRLAENELQNSVSISACDATGPAGWVGPAVYRYIAAQVREYLFANRIQDEWKPYIHDWLNQAIQRAIANAREQMPDQESATRFDDAGEVNFTVGLPSCNTHGFCSGPMTS
ncbi:MAG TPA: nucleotide-binding protein [Thermoanaerobaculia bacterium]|jgi:hypothetical protein